MQNRECKPCRHRVRRSQLHSVSAGAAKTPYPQPSSSFPNCDRFTGSQFGHLEFYNAARDLDDGGHFSAYGYGKNRDFHTPQVQSKALVDGGGAGGTIRKVSPVSFFFCQAFSFWRSKKKMPSVSPFLEKANKEKNVDTKPARNF